MTPEQYRRWVRFSLRMAHRGWPRLPRKSRRKTAEMVKDFFRGLDRELIPRIRSWDHTDVCATCIVNRSEAERTQNWYKLNTCYCAPLVCDMTTEILDGLNPFTYDAVDWRYRRWDDLWGNRAQCCIRAGLDLACEPSAGVLGFEVCDLRRMYRGNIPAWINDGRWVNRAGETAQIDLNQGECAVGIWL